jgi:hypothetical protein
VAFAALSISPRLDACTSAFQNDMLRATANEYGGDVRVFHAWDLPIVTIDIGLSVGASWLRQTFQTAGSAPSRDTVAARSSIGAGASLDIGGGFHLVAESSLETYLFRLQREGGWSTVAPSVAFRERVGMGKSW